jgi:hypothetical protein
MTHQPKPKMNPSVLEYLADLGPESKARVAKHFSNEVEEFSRLVTKMIATLQSYHARNPMHDEDSPKQVAYGLMTKGTHTLMAGFELALAGYRWEPSIVFRSALEGFATAWDIVHNPARFAVWKAKKQFKSSDSISSVKEATEAVGKLYGHLSNMGVHTNPLNSSPAMILVDGEPQFQCFGFLPSGKEYVRKTEIYISILAAYVFLQLVEFVFHEYAAEPETIRKTHDPSTVLTRVSEKHRKFVEAMGAHFAAIANDESLSF